MKREYEALSKLIGRNFAVLNDGISVYLTPEGEIRDVDGKILMEADAGRAKLFEKNLKSGEGGGVSREEFDRLSEEIAEIKDATSNKPFTETGDIVTFNGVEGGAIEITGTCAADFVGTVSLEHCGKNVIDMSKAVGNNEVTSVVQDGWIVLEKTQADVEAGVTQQYYNANIINAVSIRPNTKYNVYYEFASDTFASSANVSFMAVENKVNNRWSTTLPMIMPVSQGVYKATALTKDVFTAANYISVGGFAIFPTGTYGKIKYRMWVERAEDNAQISSQFERVNSAEYVPYDGRVYTRTLASGHGGEYKWDALTARKGINNVAVTNGSVTVKGEIAGSGVIVTTGEAKFDASKYNIPIVYLYGDTSKMTKDNAVTLDYKYGDLVGTCTCKWQGSSSLSWPKKNYTIKFDNEFEAKEGWGAQKKYCFKANFIDHSHCRNVVSCKLWGEIVKSRSGAPSELKNLPNGGAIDGFPCVIVLNDEFHGLYTWNIPKDSWLFGNPKAILCADRHVAATQFKGLATLNGDFELEYVEDEDNADWVLPSINTAIQAVMDSNGTDLDTTVNQYIDISSAIDYYIHTVDEAAADATDKNYILVTFDKVKWYFSAYDRDTVYGLDWDGKKFYAPNVGTTYQNYANTHRLMGLIYEHKAADLKSRAVALHKGAKSEANVANVFTNFASGIPSQILDEDARKWPTIPATTTSNIWQILNWYRLRMISMNAWLDGIQLPTNLFNIGTSPADYIAADTGAEYGHVVVDALAGTLTGADKGAGSSCLLRDEEINATSATYNFSATFTPTIEGGSVLPRLLVRSLDADENVITTPMTGWKYLDYYKACYLDEESADFTLPAGTSKFMVGFVLRKADDSIDTSIKVSNIMLRAL